MVRNNMIRCLACLVIVIGLAGVFNSCGGTTPTSTSPPGPTGPTGTGPTGTGPTGTGPTGTGPTGTGTPGARSTILNSALVVHRRGPAGGNWIKTLLEAEGVSVTVTDWSTATLAYALNFDLVIVTGDNRTIYGAVVTGYDRPVLTIGSFGYSYFGRMDYKNGYPYS